MKNVRESGIVKFGSFGVMPRGMNNADVMTVWFCGHNAWANGREQPSPCAHATKAKAVKCLGQVGK